MRRREFQSRQSGGCQEMEREVGDEGITEIFRGAPEGAGGDKKVGGHIPEILALFPGLPSSRAQITLTFEPKTLFVRVREGET